MKIALKIGLFFLLCLGVIPWIRPAYRIPPVFENAPPYNPAWECPLSEEIQSIFSQPFTYLGSGNQAICFESEDKGYVLKIFRYSRTRFLWIQRLKNTFKKVPKMDFLTKITKTLKAAHIAATLAKEETQILYHHLNITQNTLPTILLDKKPIALDNYRFVLQKKVTPFHESLLQARKDPEKMEVMMASFLSLIENRLEKNVQNSDPNLKPNFGFLDTQAVEIDFGNYEPIEPNSTIHAKELERFQERFTHWFKKYAPEYLDQWKYLLKSRTSRYSPDQ